MISGKFIWQALKVNNLTGQADTRAQIDADTSGSRWPKKTASLINKATSWFGSEIGRCWVSHLAIIPVTCRLD
jgi:hypothetical protein